MADTGVNEQAEAASEIEQDRAMSVLRYLATTDNLESVSEHNRAGAAHLEAKAQFLRTLGGCAALATLAGVAALLIEVLR